MQDSTRHQVTPRSRHASTVLAALLLSDAVFVAVLLAAVAGWADFIAWGPVLSSANLLASVWIALALGVVLLLLALLTAFWKGRSSVWLIVATVCLVLLPGGGLLLIFGFAGALGP